jgi:hypothetical protein
MWGHVKTLFVFGLVYDLNKCNSGGKTTGRFKGNGGSAT